MEILELELVKRQIGGSTIRLTKLNISTVTGYTKFIRVKNPYTDGDMWEPDLHIEKTYPFTLYIESSNPKKDSMILTWCSTLTDEDDVVELIKENNFSNIKKLINAIKQHLCEHGIEYKVFRSLADLKKDRTASVAVILRDDITVTVIFF